MRHNGKLLLNENQLLDAREWISDCQGSFLDIQSEEDVDALSDEEVIKGIEKWFDGGINSFIKTCPE